MRRLIGTVLLAAAVTLPLAGTAQADDCGRWVHVHTGGVLGNVCLGPQN